ncbi:hypothetical protein Tco_0717991 [Tanacetum coccineum]
MVAFLEKSTGSEGFHQVIDFLSRSHICYALIRKPEIYISFIKQFWRTSEATTADDGVVTITARIDGQSKTITEASLRIHLKLEDHDGVETIPNSEIFKQLALMGYQTDSDSPKKTSWEQFSSNIAIAIICLATNRKFIQICLDMQRKQLQTHTKTYPVPSLSAKVFSNMKRPTKGYSGVEVALFPTMLQVHTPESSPAPSSSPSRITSSPSLSSEPSPEPSTAAPQIYEPQTTQSSPDEEQHVPTPHDSPLHDIHSHGSNEGRMTLNELMKLVFKLTDRIGALEKDLQKTKKTYNTAFTKLILRVKILESKVKTGKARRRARILLSEDKDDILDDSSKQGRKISDIDEDPDAVLAQGNGVEWIQEDEEVHDKASDETKLILQEETPTEVIEEKGSGEKGEKEVSTADIPVSTAGVTTSTADEPTGTATEAHTFSTAHIDISTASTIRSDFRSTAGRVVYNRRIVERKDKGKAIMTEPKPKKKSKKELEQERLSYAEAIRLQEQADKEQRAQIARDEEIAKQWAEEERKIIESKSKTSKEIDWNDPSTQRYWAQKNKPKTEAQARRNMIVYLKNQSNYNMKDFKGMSYDHIRPIFEKVWEFNQAFLAKGSEEIQEEKGEAEKIEEEDKHEQIIEEVSKKSGGKRRKLLARKRTKEAQGTSKRLLGNM